MIDVWVGDIYYAPFHAFISWCLLFVVDSVEEYWTAI